MSNKNIRNNYKTESNTINISIDPSYLARMEVNNLSLEDSHFIAFNFQHDDDASEDYMIAQFEAFLYNEKQKKDH